MKREPKRHTSRRERERERKRQNKKKGVVRSKQKAREIERESCSSHPLSDADGRRAREGRNKRCLHSLLFVVLERDQEGEEEEHTHKKKGRERGQRPTRNGLHGDEREKAKPLAPKEKRKRCSPRTLTRKESSPTGGWRVEAYIRLWTRVRINSNSQKSSSISSSCTEAVHTNCDSALPVRRRSSCCSSPICWKERGRP